MMFDWGWGWGAMMFGGLMMVVFWGLLIALIVWIVRAFAGPTQRDGGTTQRPPGQSPMEILQARYARGEISRDEYETIRHDLEHT